MIVVTYRKSKNTGMKEGWIDRSVGNGSSKGNLFVSMTIRVSLLVISKEWNGRTPFYSNDLFFSFVTFRFVIRITLRQVMATTTTTTYPTSFFCGRTCRAKAWRGKERWAGGRVGPDVRVGVRVGAGARRSHSALDPAIRAHWPT